MNSVFDGTIADLTWPEVESAGQRHAIMLLPVAVIEQHGPHLPLATDVYGAYVLCAKAREELERLGIEALVAPPYYFGVNSTTGMFPGSLTISRDLMSAVLAETMANYASWGFTRQFVLNHHGDPQHNHAIVDAIRAARSRGADASLVLGGWLGDVVGEVYAATFGEPIPLPDSAIVRASESEETRRIREQVSRSHLNIHAEEKETSLVMRWFPQTLNQDIQIDRLEPVLPTMDEFNEACGRGGWRELSPLGYVGDPSVASRENGELYAYEAADMARAIAAAVRTSDS